MASRTAAQDGGVAGFQAQGSRVGGNVRAGFVDDADDAERHPHLADLDAGRRYLMSVISPIGSAGVATCSTPSAMLSTPFRTASGGRAGRFRGRRRGRRPGLPGWRRPAQPSHGGWRRQCAAARRSFGGCRPGQAARGSTGLAADRLHVFLDIHYCHHARQRVIIARQIRGNFRKRLNSYPPTILGLSIEDQMAEKTDIADRSEGLRNLQLLMANAMSMAK